MRIAVVHDYGNAFRAMPSFADLADHEVVVFENAYTDQSRLVEELDGCQAAVLTMSRIPFTRFAAERLPDLEFISQGGPSAAHVDLDACTEHGIVVSAGPMPRPSDLTADSAGMPMGGGYATTAELTWALILASMRHIPREVEDLKRGHWQSTIGERLYGQTLGIYAFGNIGASVARVGEAFGMRVLCWGRAGSTERAMAAGFDVAPDRSSFFESVDVLSLHLPGNADTRGIVSAEDLGRMKPTARLINTSRASIIEDGALVGALQAGRPGFAAVDVYEEEPIVGAEHPLLALPNAICTPHLGYAERSRYEAIYSVATEQLLAYAAGAPINVVNPDAIGRR